MMGIVFLTFVRGERGHRVLGSLFERMSPSILGCARGHCATGGLWR